MIIALNHPYFSFLLKRSEFNTERVMKQAMQNVERHYAVVGVIEQLNKTLTVLEHYVPRFFKGALESYWGEYISLLFSLIL